MPALMGGSLGAIEQHTVAGLVVKQGDLLLAYFKRLMARPPVVALRVAKKKEPVKSDVLPIKHPPGHAFNKLKSPSLSLTEPNVQERAINNIS